MKYYINRMNVTRAEVVEALTEEYMTPEMRLRELERKARAEGRAQTDLYVDAPAGGSVRMIITVTA